MNRNSLLTLTLITAALFPAFGGAAENNTATSKAKPPNANAAVTPVTAGPTIDKKEATSEILLKNGETTVLGGIFEENRSDSTQGVPWFNRIPFLGWLFKNEGVSVTQTELLVFVTPTLIKE